jgi:CubicO group peptidase (beta-lactamase class C family)
VLRTTFDPLRAAHDSLALPHDLAEDGTVVPVSPGWPDPMADPAGGAFSTLNDLANFACMHLSDGQFQGREVLSPSSIQAMYGRQVDKEPQPGVPYTPGEGQALAFALTPYDGTELVEHIGNAHGYFSIFTLLPSHQAGLILLLNRPEPGPFFAVLDTVLESLLGGSADAQPSSSAG